MLLLAIALLAVLGVTVVPALIEQVNELANRLPTWIDSGGEQLQALSGAVLNFLLDAISSVLNLILAMVLTFYLPLHGERLWNGIFQWFPSSDHDPAAEQKTTIS